MLKIWDMKICIDARMMGAGRTRGIGRYIEELIKAMVIVAPENDYIILHQTGEHIFKENVCVKTVIADIPWYSAKEQIRLPQILESVDCDLVHFPHWNIPLAYRKPFVVTIHDLLLKHQPMSAKSSLQSWPMRLIKKAGYGAALNYALKGSKKVIVPTEFVKKDIVSFYPEIEKKIMISGEGLSKLPKPVEIEYNFDYLLYVGSAYPHKRVEDLLSAWMELQTIYPELHLVIAGEMDDFMSRIKSRAVDINLERVIFDDRVADDRLAALYNNARIFVFPSSFEGFGHPPLEALAQGCPVVCSDAGPMREVLGDDGVIYFKTGEVNGMINAVKTVVDNQNEYKNKALAVKNTLAEKFSWHKTAQKTLDVYNKAL